MRKDSVLMTIFGSARVYQRTLGLCFIALTALQCSAVDSVYVRRAQTLGQPTPVKRIAIVAWAPKAHAPLDEVLAHVSRDLVKQYKNYLVDTASFDAAIGVGDACSNREGVVVVRATDVDWQSPAKLRLRLETELFDCRDGSLIWRALGETSLAAANADLQQLTQAYVDKINADAGRYTAPAFVLLKQLIKSMPNPPPPTDEELLEMIESSSVRTYSDAHAAL